MAGSGSSSSSGSNTTACAACKYQRRKCTPDCPLSPYFPPDQPKRFQNVHRLFGVSNVLRILKDVDPSKRDDAVKSIAYEADTRENDPVHGCLGVITILQNQVSKLKDELALAREQLYLLQQQHHLNLNQYNLNQQPQMQQFVMPRSFGGSTSVSHASQQASGVLIQYNEPPPSTTFETDQFLRTDNFDVKPRFDGNERYTRADAPLVVLQRHHHVKREAQAARQYHGSIVEDHKVVTGLYASRGSSGGGLLNLSMATSSDSGVYLTLMNN